MVILFALRSSYLYADIDDSDYWGYELTIPHSQMAQLANVHSVSSTLLSFFQAFVVYSGAPELAPFIRYLSSYIDLEFKGIELQDKGHGVVLAATCELPFPSQPCERKLRVMNGDRDSSNRYRSSSVMIPLTNPSLVTHWSAAIEHAIYI